MAITAKSGVLFSALLLSAAGGGLAAQDSFQDAVRPATHDSLPEAAAPLALDVDLGAERKFGPYMLVTHNETIYDGTFILVLKKIKPEREGPLRAAIAGRLKTRVFDRAPVFVAMDAFVAMLKKHPDQTDYIKREYALMYRHLAKERIAAIAFRPAKDETEGVRR